MNSRPVSKLIGRKSRIAVVAALVALAWYLWFVLPPSPEVRLQFVNAGTYGWWGIAADGQTLVFVKNKANSDNGTSSNQEYLVNLYELPSGKWRKTISGPKGFRQYVCSPDGKQIACRTDLGHWQFFTLPAGELLGTISDKGDIHIEWSSDGRHFVIIADKTMSLFRLDTRAELTQIPKGSPFCFFPDGSGIVTGSNDGKRLDVWTFSPFQRADSLELPYPPSGAFNESTEEAPKPGTMNVMKLVVSQGGRFIAAVINHYEPEGDGMAAVSIVEYWDRVTRVRKEIVEGNYDVQNVGGLQVSADGRFVSHSGTYMLGNRSPLPVKWTKTDRKLASSAQSMFNSATTNAPECHHGVQ
jgi:WD40 repeat protein